MSDTEPGLWTQQLVDLVDDTVVKQSLVEYQQILDAYDQKYGFYSIACLLAKYHLLSQVIEIGTYLLDSGNSRYLELIDRARRLVQDHYDSTRRAPQDATSYAPVQRVSTPAGEQIFYPADAYDRHLTSDPCVQDQVREIDSTWIDAIVPRQFYIYAIDADMVPVVYGQSMGLTGLLGTENRLTTPSGAIAHPVLVRRRGLSVYGAGEILFTKTVDGALAGAIVNNKSGHFRPSANSLAIVTAAVANGLGIDAGLVVPIAVERIS
ncbi:hypothetical protein ACWEO2_26290 [Nocardia sp. NPDC004278]